jgi:DNA-binding MarR family transcriptional regulator
MTRHLAAAGKRQRTRRLRSPEVYPAGEPLFPLRELPKYEALEALARRFPELDPSAAEAYLVLLRVSTDILAAMDTHLVLLRADGDGISPSVLAARSGVTRATVTGLVDGLEREGFIRREGSRHDRRSHAVRLTPRGEEFLRDMLPAHFRRVAGLMAKLTAADRKTLVRLLARVNQGLPSIRDP